MGRLEIAGVRVVLTLLDKGGSESVMSGELMAAAAAELGVEVVSARFKLVAVEVVSVGFVSLEEVEGAEVSVELVAAGWIMVDVETEFMVDVGLIASAVVEEVEVVGGRAAELAVEEQVMGASCETAAVIISLELGGGDVVVVTNESDVTELLDVTEVDSATGLMVVDEPDGISDVLVEGKEAAVVTEIAASPTAAWVASAERTIFGSGKVDLVDRFVDAVETEISLLGAEAVSEVVMEGLVIVVELEVTGRLGVMESEEGVEVTETVAGGSVGVVVLVSVAGTVEVGNSVVGILASGTEASLLSTVPFVGVVAAAGGLTESVHISVSEGGTVLEGETVTSAESGVEIVGAAGAVVAAVVVGAAAGLSLVGVFVSASCIWASSFSGVLRPDVVGGGPGLITGFGSKAGFPAASCADTLARI